MKWFLWLIFVSLAVAAAALLLRDGGDTGSIASAAPLAAVTERDVRVKHELVTVTVPPLDAPNHASARREPRRAGTVALERPARREASLLEKASRALVGDGTHRPEPFPRIRDF